jgi:hypothetical protein
VITYLCAKMVDELMLAFVASIIFSLIVFYPIKLQVAPPAPHRWFFKLFFLVLHPFPAAVLARCVGAGRSACRPPSRLVHRLLTGSAPSVCLFSPAVMCAAIFPRHWLPGRLTLYLSTMSMLGVCWSLCLSVFQQALQAAAPRPMLAGACGAGAAGRQADRQTGRARSGIALQKLTLAWQTPVQGAWVLFWLIYFCTLSIGIGM